MKAVIIIVKVLAALAAVAGVVYVIATYGDKIVAWAKKMLGTCKCCNGECTCEGECECEGECKCECEAEDIEVEVCEFEEVVEASEPACCEAEPCVEEPAAEEAPAEEVQE